MATRLKPTDVVIVGLGWTGAILAHELTQAGLDVVAIERGKLRDTVPDFPPSVAPDELRYAIRHDLALPTAEQTLTFRNTAAQTALPIRTWGSFIPASGVGGAGVHWNGQTWRHLPTDFAPRSHLIARYGRNALPPDSTLQDYPISYADLEPHYDKFEYLCGISGRAGNLRGRIQPGGNRFEGARARDYPLPPLTARLSLAAAGDDLRPHGCSPRPPPSSACTLSPAPPPTPRRPIPTRSASRSAPAASAASANVSVAGNYSKASPQTTILPVLARTPNFTRPPALRSAARQHRRHRQARYRRHLHRRPRRGMGTAGRARAALRLRTFQRAPAAAVRHRHAVRPARRHRRDRPQLRLPDAVLSPDVLRRQDSESLHRRRCARPDHRRLERRQFRSFRSWLHRRRHDRPVQHQRPPDPEPPDAPWHAALGQRLEACHDRALSAQRDDRLPGQFAGGTAATSSTSTPPTPTETAARCCA